ncbi:MAG: hypothetical protein JWO06_1264 [Bacteroidota bacterium]|nr:hypothetical protein [Bacteroidota bacterium]
MKTITFESNSEKKLSLLVEVAREMGIKAKPMRELSDEEMGIPGGKVSKEQLEDWLSKDDGESFELKEGLKVMKKNLANKLKKKNGHRN